MSWPVGTIVVCVDDSSHDVPGANYYGYTLIGAPLVKGCHYTVRGACRYNFGLAHGVLPAVFVAENARIREDGVDFPWAALRFRLAEGGACESERARAMQPITTHGKANK